MEWIWNGITCFVALINGLQIKKVCPTLPWILNNHNHHNVAKFGTVWSHRVLFCGEISSQPWVLGSLFDSKGLEICFRWLWPRFLWKESWVEVNRSGGAFMRLGDPSCHHFSSKRMGLFVPLSHNLRVNCPKFTCFSRPKNLSFPSFVKARECVISIQHLTSGHTL